MKFFISKFYAFFFSKKDIFFSREGEGQSWGKYCDDVELSQKLWAMSALWTNLGERLNTLLKPFVG